jgi:hypothetical protein
MSLLVYQLATYLIKAVIAKGTSYLLIRHHSRDTKIFYPNGVGSATQRSCHFLRCVFPDLGDVQMLT